MTKFDRYVYYRREDDPMSVVIHRDEVEVDWMLDEPEEAAYAIELPPAPDGLILINWYVKQMPPPFRVGDIVYFDATDCRDSHAEDLPPHRAVGRVVEVLEGQAKDIYKGRRVGVSFLFPFRAGHTLAGGAPGCGRYFLEDGRRLVACGASATQLHLAWPREEKQG